MKFLKWVVIILIIFTLLVVFVGMPYMQEQTKKHSPETTASYNKNGLDLFVKYSSPAKKGRVIFGNLVPFDTIWRTGANEPTTFTTKSAIRIIDKKLAAGTYSLWTRPKKDSWTVIFNSEIPDWGVTLLSGGTKTTRNPKTDVVVVEVPIKRLATPQENFTISFKGEAPTYLSLSWDDTIVQVPINP